MGAARTDDRRSSLMDYFRNPDANHSFIKHLDVHGCGHMRPLDMAAEIDHRRRAGQPGCVLKLRQAEVEQYSDADAYYNLAIAYEDMRMYDGAVTAWEQDTISTAEHSSHTTQPCPKHAHSKIDIYRS